MLKNFIKFLSRNFALFFAIVALQIFPQTSFSNDEISDAEVIDAIEKSLVFDKDSRDEISFYKQQNSQQKSDFKLKAGIEDNAKKEKNDAINIVVTNSKTDNFDAREKEKFAYNANLVGQYEVAVEILKQVLIAEPNNDYAKFSLAVTYQKIGQFRQAKTLYSQLLKNNPENQDEIIGNLLAILIEESPRDAIYLLSRLITQNPKSANIMAQAATAYDKIKNYDQAATLLQKAVLLDPANLDYKYNLAIIYDKTAQYEKALEVYGDVLRNYSDSNQSIPFDKIRKRIQSIKNKI